MAGALSPAVRAFLEAPRFAVLATVSPAGSPVQSVMWYELVGDEILMNTRRGRVKDRHITRDRRVSICVEDGYRFVAISGKVTRVVDDQREAHADILRLGVRYDGREKADREFAATWSKQERVTYFVSVERVHAPGFEEVS